MPFCGIAEKIFRGNTEVVALPAVVRRRLLFSHVGRYSTLLDDPFFSRGTTNKESDQPKNTIG